LSKLIILKYYIFIYFFLFSSVIIGQANQDSIKKEFLTIGIGPQLNAFFGDVSSNHGEKIFTNRISALTFDIEKRIGKVIGLQLMVIKGKLSDHNLEIPYGFESEFIKSNLNIIFNTDNYFDNLHNFSIYSAVGFGIMKYSSSSDNLMILDTNNSMGLSYEYDTNPNESISLLAPISIGFKWKMNPYIQARLYATYNSLLSDDIDNIKSGSNDSYASLGFSINYAFHKITRVKKQRIAIDLEKFDLTDEDGDGVIDLEDLCHHTPKKVEVDNKGCPKDKDNDGVPDYLDIEPESKYILHVDEKGRSLTDSIIFYRSHPEDSVEIEINKTFSIDTTQTVTDSLNNINNSSIITKDSLLIEKDFNKLENEVPVSDTLLNNEMNYIPFQKEIFDSLHIKKSLFLETYFLLVNSLAIVEESIQIKI
jgi:hypothetical protein